MFKRLLVPLDGSQMAESVIPAVLFLQEKLAVSVNLVHIVEKNAPREVHGQHHLASEAEAESYLRELAQKSFSKSTKVNLHVHSAEIENVAKSISDHVEELESDLIVMCTHGRGGMHHLLVGSIAQQVIAMGATPVLLIKPPAEENIPAFQIEKILTPLDGQADHEISLEKSKYLAKKLGGSLHLLLVVHTYGHLSGQWTTTSRLLPGSTTELLDIEVQNATEYLGNLKDQLEKEGFTATADVFRGDPADVITKFTLDMKIDLIALGTHAKKGIDAFWAGSITPKICKKCPVPFLLIPIHPSEK